MNTFVITNIDKNQVELNILEKVDIQRESDLKIKVYQGLPKGPKMEMILQKLTEVGVDEIILVQTKRTVVKSMIKRRQKAWKMGKNNIWSSKAK